MMRISYLWAGFIFHERLYIINYFLLSLYGRVTFCRLVTDEDEVIISLAVTLCFKMIRGASTPVFSYLYFQGVTVSFNLSLYDFPSPYYNGFVEDYRALPRLHCRKIHVLGHSRDSSLGPQLLVGLISYYIQNVIIFYEDKLKIWAGLISHLLQNIINFT